jgi:catechol 2,3-dioxygenase-like lactoylglutathione lyase family enzyme
MAVRRVKVDHITVGVGDLERSTAFYVAALTPLGYAQTHTNPALPHEVEFGPPGVTDFAISTDYPVGAPIHVAFLADTTEQVDAFHRAALEAGARDNGAPGPRPEYSPGYYGAFVLDPDGHNVEAVCHGSG